MSLIQLAAPGPKILVVSHERSGTHFLMNSIEKCFGYIASTWVNFDPETIAMNYHAPEMVEQFFNQFRGRYPANIFKSHHPYQFFEKAIHSVADEFQIFYVYRDPRDVMVSLCRFLNKLPWHEGPKVPSAKEFIRSAPAGQMLRYQWKQEPSMLHRWRTHVDSWTLGVPEILRCRVTFVRFRDLHFNYESVIREIGQKIGPPVSFEKPTFKDTAVLPYKGEVGSHIEHFDADDLAYFREVAGPTMDRLGFSDVAEPAATKRQKLDVAHLPSFAGTAGAITSTPHEL